jgi:capsular exopolysaccharide synthesis family protein
MSSRTIPSQLPSSPQHPSTALAPQYGYNVAPPGSWGPPPSQGSRGADDDDEKKTPWHRYISALNRFKWLILAVVAGGSACAIVATQLMTPAYEAHATLWIQPEQRGGGTNSNGPIGAGELLATASWVDLFKSVRVTEPVIRKLRMFVHHDPIDRDAFEQFQIGESYTPGQFVMTIDPRARKYALATNSGAIVERGVLGDSIGRKMGWRWQPSAASLTKPVRKIRFTVASLSDASESLNKATTVFLPENSNFIRLSLVGTNPQRVSDVLNAWLDSFILQAADLKKRKLVEVTNTIDGQRQIAQARLKSAEDALQNFETANIRSGAGPGPSGPGAAGANAAGADPAVGLYLSVKLQHDNLRADITTAEQVLEGMRASQTTPDALLAIPSLMTGADNLRTAIAEYNAKEAQLRDLQRTYTDEYKGVQDAKAQLALLGSQTIPQLANFALGRLRTQDNNLEQQLTTSDRVIQQVPTRLIDGMRKQREVAAAAEISTSLNKAYEQSRLAEAGAIPDVQILDRAEPPHLPTRNTAPRILMMGVLGSLGLGIALALLLDQLDSRFRYPEQATDELGLNIIGTVPTLPSARQRAKDPEAAAQVVEAFRTIRMHLTHMFDPTQPITLTLSSPGAGEGKSLISSNLAMSFAESGRRTLLVDGDIRRGQLNSAFGVKQSPGLLDYLLGQNTLDEVLQETDFERLTLVTCGTRRHRGPELLQSAEMAQFLAAVKPHFDMILVDSPPLGAGIDPFALAHVTGNLLVVLRVGHSDRKMAQAKLAAMDRLAGVRQLGAVLNDVETIGVFRYYSYLYGYKLDEGELRAQIPSKVGEVSGSKSVTRR